jgi:galactosamine-6-phosphate isomerase
MPNGPKVLVADHYEAMSRQAARVIDQELRRRPDLLLGAATGSSPARTYELLGERCQQEPQLFSRLRVLKLDEWGGLPMDHPATCETHLRYQLIRPLRLAEDRYAGFRSQPTDPRGECARISDWLAGHGPIDVAVLGLGLNGHLALNEPAETLPALAHVAALTPESLQHSMLRSGPVRPSFGLTLGVGELLRSRKILLLVNGRHKRAQLERLLTPEISTRFPASFLWMHADVTVFCDREAASELEITRPDNVRNQTIPQT